MQYIERDGAEHFHTLHDFPDRLTKKVTLLKYFRNYMSQHLLKVETRNFHETFYRWKTVLKFQRKFQWKLHKLDILIKAFQLTC